MTLIYYYIKDKILSNGGMHIKYSKNRNFLLVSRTKTNSTFSRALENWGYME
jgi:hypothetical protein